MKKQYALSLALAALMGLGASGIALGAACCGADETDNGAQVNMDKGGAAKDNTAEGYKVGQKVPNFSLKDSDGKEHSLADYKDKVVVLVFYNQSCPFVQEMEGRLVDFTKTYAEKGVQVLAIDAGVNNQAGDVAKKAKSVPFPILVNSDSDLAVKFDASRTPEVIVVDKNGVIQYHGMFDNGEKGGEEGNRKSPAKDAVDAVLAGKEVAVKQTEAFGCTIKKNKIAENKETKKDAEKDAKKS